MIRRTIDNTMSLLPLIPMSMFEQSGLSDIIDSGCGDGDDNLSMGGLVRAMVGTFFHKDDPHPDSMDQLYRGNVPRHLFGHHVSPSDLTPARFADRLSRMGGTDLCGTYRECYLTLIRNYGLTSDSYSLGFDCVRIDRNGREEHVAIVRLTDSNCILCDCRPFENSGTVRDMMSDLALYTDPEDTVVYCDATVLKTDVLEEVHRAGFRFVAKCPDEYYGPLETSMLSDIADGKMEPTVSTKSWHFYETFDRGMRKRVTVCQMVSCQKRDRMTETLLRNEVRLLSRMEDASENGVFPDTDYLRRIHPVLQSPDDEMDYGFADVPVVLVGTVRPYEYNHGMTPLTLLTRYYSHCYRRHALSRIRHMAVHADGFRDDPGTDRTIIFVGALSMLLADVMEARLRTFKNFKRMSGMVHDFSRATAGYDETNDSAVVYSDRSVCDSFFEYSRMMGLDINRMFIR